VLRSLPEPGQLELVPGLSVAKINQHEAPVCRLVPARFDKTERAPVKVQALLEIQHVDVVVIELELHRTLRCAPLY